MSKEYIEQLEKLVKSGDNSAKLRLGIIYYNGDELPQNSEKAYRLFTEAAHGGSAEAKYWLGICNYYGNGAPKDEQAAKTHFQKAADGGNEQAQNALKSFTFENDELIALAESGDAEAQYKLGDFYCDCYYSRGAGLPTYTTAAYWFLKAAKQDHPMALRRLESISVWATDYKEISKGMAKRGLELYKRLAEEGDAVAQYEVAKWYMPAKDFPEGSAEKAFYWYRKSAENGYIPALLGLSYCYYHGIGVETDFEKAVSLLEEAGARGSAEDKYQVALHYNNNNKIEDLKKVAFWLEKAAEAGHTLSQYHTAENYFYGRIYGRYTPKSKCEQNYEKAVYWYKKAEDGGKRSAKYSLANCYYKGLGVQKDYKKAVELFLEIARGTHGYGYDDKGCCALAAKRIADCYFKGGFGIEKDVTRAINWYESAACRDVKTACTKLGDIYMRGWGVERDYELAAGWYESALFDYQDYCYGGCEYYDMDANAKFADCLLYGIGVRKDPEYAFAVLQDSGEYMSHDPSQYRLGRCYFHGLGVKQDLDKARGWWRSAAGGGDKYAKAALKKYFDEEVEPND